MLSLTTTEVLASLGLEPVQTGVQGVRTGTAQMAEVTHSGELTTSEQWGERAYEETLQRLDYFLNFLMVTFKDAYVALVLMLMQAQPLEMNIFIPSLTLQGTGNYYFHFNAVEVR